MPLMKAKLEKDLADAFKLRTKLIGKGEVSPDEIEERIAKAVANAIHNYIMMGDVNVFPGIVTVGSMASQVSVTPGKGKVM